MLESPSVGWRALCSPSRVFREIEDFVRLETAQGVSIAYVLPPSATATEPTVFEQKCIDLLSSIEGLTLLELRGQGLAENQFFDTAYHLNKSGVDQRTEALVLALRSWLANRGQRTMKRSSSPVRPLLDPGPGVAQGHRAVEHRRCAGAGGIGAEVAETLELNRLSRLDLGQGRLELAAA